LTYRAFWDDVPDENVSHDEYERQPSCSAGHLRVSRAHKLERQDKQCEAERRAVMDECHAPGEHQAHQHDHDRKINRQQYRVTLMSTSVVPV
jgi:hypothetical protein